MKAVCLLVAVALAFQVLTNSARAAALADATGRTVELPDSITRILPAGPPAAVLLAALAPDLMLGWPHRPSDAALATLDPLLAGKPEVPGTSDTERVKALHPDLILDYGTVDPGYIKAAKDAQAATGVPSVLMDGRIAETPHVLRALGAALHREARAETLARLAEIMLQAPHAKAGRTVVMLRGPNADQALPEGGGNSELVQFLGLRLLAPDGPGRSFRHVTLGDVARLDPDMIVFLDPSVRAKIAASPDWRGLRAIHDGHAWTVPSLPFGWIEGPPSVNRLIGLAWLSGGTPRADMAEQAALFHAAFFGRAPDPAALSSWQAALQPIAP